MTNLLGNFKQLAETQIKGRLSVNEIWKAQCTLWWEIVLRCVTFVCDVEHLFNGAPMCCFCLTL